LAQVNAIRRSLVDLPSVKEVVIRWASQGRIAFEINPGESTDESEITAAVESLVEGAFTGFGLIHPPRPPSLRRPPIFASARTRAIYVPPWIVLGRS
jgi:hypothetical protein